MCSDRIGLFSPIELKVLASAHLTTYQIGRLYPMDRVQREKGRDLFFASAALVQADGGHRIDDMALYLQGSYLISRLTGRSICGKFYILHRLVGLTH